MANLDINGRVFFIDNIFVMFSQTVGIPMGKVVTRISFLVMQGVWGTPRFQHVQGAKHPMNPRLYFKLQGYFGYENDRTGVIKVVVLVVKITTQLTYGSHGFKKKEVM